MIDFNLWYVFHNTFFGVQKSYKDVHQSIFTQAWTTHFCFHLLSLSRYSSSKNRKWNQILNVQSIIYDKLSK